MSSRNLDLYFYVAFLFLTFMSIGSSFVVIAWIAVEDSSIAVLGRIFLLSSITGIVISIAGGILTDSWNRKIVVRLGLITQTTALAILLFGITQRLNLPPFLYLFSVLNTASMAVKAGAIDSIFQSIICKEKRISMSVKVSIIRQLGLAIGMGGSGFLLEHTSASICVSLLLIVSTIRFFISEKFLINLKNIKNRKSANPLKLWTEGFSYAISDKNLYISIFGVSLTFSVAQMTNTLIPGFVQNELSASSNVYGLLEMAWSIGGGSILLIAAFKRYPSTLKNFEAFLLCLLGSTMVAFSFLRFIPALILLYAIMGGLFSITRARFDGKLLTHCSEDMIGRIRATTSVLTNSSGMIIYLIPTIFPITSVSILYTTWGAIIVLVGFIIWILKPT
ncbi:Major Facilitator Superfamily protein [Vreelandella subterranea]|uniref:Major Facilitator Superfamily protein n=1 Tax=Vreelandella subterranea TaxID=416874 RepID=A0A1H9WQP2_9GAMM|nr:MFS transporter [Halomonas subterranea]SES36195.1 Major Facilitator Superfamily protein [Halomonas subterranea]